MLKIEINKGETSININGTMADIMTDITILLRSIYNGLSGEAKQDFEHDLETLVKTRIYAMSEEDIDKAAKRLEKAVKDKESFLKALKDGDDDDFIAYLKDILK